MLRSQSFIFSFAAAAVIAMSTLTISTVHYAVNTLRAARDWVTEQFMRAVNLSQPKAGEVASTPERMVRTAEQYAVTQIKRQRPRIENSFRMCPST